jgi:aryl-alcohol dehydrogenase-like predicted oxidoreductase
MTSLSAPPGGTYQLGDLTVSRVGYGAMQLAGPHPQPTGRDRRAVR